MNLATRCTTCGTIFRVVQDQLRVSEGWVRCGRCAEVFDAREQLFDLERDSPPPWPPMSTPPEAPVERRPEPSPAPVAAPTSVAAPPQQPSPAPAYERYQSDFQPSQPAPMPPAPQSTPIAAPMPVSAPAMFTPAPLRAPEPPHHHQAPRDSGWIAADDESLNPFAPPRRVSDEEIDDVIDARFQAPAALDEHPYEERREPFLDAPPPVEDPRAHLPEPKGMRFEEDELPPPMIDDDARPDVTFALSPATAAQLRGNDPADEPVEPSFQAAFQSALEPTSSMMAPDEDSIAEARRAAKAAKPRRSWNPFRRKKKERPATESPETTMTVLAAESELLAARAAMAEAGSVDAAAAAGSPSVMPEHLPSFMRQAESQQRWNRPIVRLALGTGTTVLALGLMGQLLWHAREAIAAQYPAAKPALSAVAQAMGQELKPWQHIEALSVESSSLNPAGAANHYRFSISLRNRSGWDVAQPWVDLSLTDASGALVVRRMLSPAEMQASPGALAAGADQQLQLVFDSGAQKISGYSVELFYP